MTVETTPCLKVGAALRAAVGGAADIRMRFVVLHKDGSVTKVSITAETINIYISKQ